MRELFENATRGLFSLMHEGGVSAVVERPVRVTGSGGVANLLVDWLSEIITLAATHGEIYSDVSVKKVTDDAVDGVVAGEVVDARRHRLRFDVKAATYHGLVVEEDHGRVRGRVIFDL